MPRNETATARPRAAFIGRSEIRTLVSAAAMAPSVLNTQPWSFEVRGSIIDLFADEDRRLYRSVDPLGRQLVISCGAALFNLRVAAAHVGRPTEVTLRPDPEQPALLASIALGPRATSRPRHAELFPSIWRRHTHRRPFAPRSVPGLVLAELVSCAHDEGANIVPVSQTQREWLYDLIAFSEILLADSVRYEVDLASWTDGSSSRQDGVPESAFGSLAANSWPPMRDFGVVHGTTQQREHYARDPWLAMLTTRRDDEASWLRAGQALQRVLLTATERGLAASFLNQPLDEPEVRHDLVSETLGGYPQMIVRLGYPTGTAVTPRRSAEDLIRSRKWR